MEGSGQPNIINRCWLDPLSTFVLHGKQLPAGNQYSDLWLGRATRITEQSMPSDCEMRPQKRKALIDSRIKRYQMSSFPEHIHACSLKTSEKCFISRSWCLCPLQASAEKRELVQHNCYDTVTCEQIWCDCIFIYSSMTYQFCNLWIETDSLHSKVHTFWLRNMKTFLLKALLGVCVLKIPI